MKEFGKRNPNVGVEAFGLTDLGAVYWNLGEAALVEHAIRNGEGELVEDGAFCAVTGQHTGRSPKDKFVVRDETTSDNVWWAGNGALEPAKFDLLLEDFRAHARGLNLYAQDLYGSADPTHRIGTRVYCELAWHAMFIRTMLIRPDRSELESFVPDLTIIDLPSFKADPKRYGVRTETVIAMDIKRRIVLVGGSSYAGEMKKSVFTMLNYLLPSVGVLPMHCSANHGPKGDSALFFGLSGTGKTTLSADPQRTLIGDDEHGWGPNGIFNFEGGCYAKTINLSQEAEPEIYAASLRFGTVLENVVFDPETRRADWDDDSLTENTRSAYPLDFIPNASRTGLAGHPKNVVMLTCDAFGVMPPIARLTPAQAIVQFLTGYTAKVAGTEKGLTEPEATFSTCFAAPFLPRPPVIYGELLRKYVEEHGATCWLVNTGWTGGPEGVGYRMPIKATRALLSAALDGSLDNVPTYVDPNFGFEVPDSVPGLDRKLLHPRETWADPDAYDQMAAKLVAMFSQNFAQYAGDVDSDVRQAAPMQAAAE